MRRTHLSRKIFVLCNTIFLILVALLCFLPLVNLFAISLSGKSAANSGLVTFWPVDFTTLAYIKTFHNSNFIRSLVISFLRTGAGTLFGMFVITTAGYALSKEFRGRTALMWFFVFTMLFGGGLIPSYLLINNWLHLSNTIFALILPGAMSAYTVIIMRNFFESIPDSLEESAKLDGANDVTILFRIMVPLSKASIATIALWSIVYHWNEWFNCMLYMKDEDKYVLQYVLRKILLDGQTQDINMATNVVVNTETMKMATLVVSILPIIMLYPFLQKYFAKGVMVGSVKG